MIETHDQQKPGNLANSAVLKMLEEEEHERVYPGYRKVAWPPASDTIPIRSLTPQPQQIPQQNQYHQPSQQQPQQQPHHSSVVSHQPSGHYQPSQQQPQQQPYHSSVVSHQPTGHYQPSQQQPQQQPYHSPVVSHQPSGHYQQQSPQQYKQPQHQQQSPQQYQQPQYQQQQQPPQQYYQPQTQPQYNQSEPQYYNPQAQQQPQYQQPQYQQQYQQQPQYQPAGGDRGQSPGIITLRKEAPISQRSAPVVQSQPAAASFGGGANMRGDLKWPPPEVKAQIAIENEERIKLAKSPTFRPRRVHKDYSSFFAKHALNSTYPGYKVPPGTQHVYAEY